MKKGISLFLTLIMVWGILTSMPLTVIGAKETTVYVTANGSKYHLSSVCSNMKNPIAKTLSEAKSLGYTPCSKCVPDDFGTECTDHVSSDWIIDKKATVNAAGKKHKECTECGEILKTAKIAQLKCAVPKITKTENTSSGVKVTWGKVTGADSYRIYRKESGGTYKKLADTTSTSYTDKTVKSGKKYYYVVKAENEAGFTDKSASKSITFVGTPTIKTPATAKAGVTVKWASVSGAEGYVVYRKTGSGSYTKIATVKGGSKVSYLDKSAKKGKKYTYKVKAYKGSTYSAYSSTKTITDKY